MESVLRGSRSAPGGRGRLARPAETTTSIWSRKGDVSGPPSWTRWPRSAIAFAACATTETTSGSTTAPPEAVLGHRASAELGGVGLAEDGTAGLFEARHDIAVEGELETGQGAGAEGRRVAGDAGQVLDRHRHARERAAAAATRHRQGQLGG